MIATAQELKTSVLKLSAEELFQFSQWFEEFMAEQWDKKIEADILAGRLDKIAEQVDNEFIAGRVKRL
jgi:hypothetical protein